MTAYEPPGTAAPYDADPYDAVVLAGGAARRLGGADKPGVRVGGRPLLDRVLAACAAATTTVVVAEPRATARPVRWAREEPPGGGPLAALDAGLRRTSAADVVVLSADLPFLDEETVGRLLDTLRGSDGPRGPGHPDGVLLSDPEGRDQPLVAAYRAGALRRELAALAAAHGGLTGLPLRRLTAALDLTRISDPVASFDCDTWDDIAAARSRIREHGHVLDEWISAVKDELGIDLDVDTGVLLDLARDAAHGVARPAAPLTTFLVGYAAARAGGGPEAVAEAARKAGALALRWADEDTPGDTPGAEPGTGSGVEPGTGSGAEPGSHAPTPSAAEPGSDAAPDA
ncbi:NTP transferase domain-containing protein [Streptomyces sp. NPDC057950]|uniref:NTP transferase domain-containing protein n=1 Tax=Streptomyces sp. NPDC057950 TaxID=3346288 RepID=UPI0036E89E3A